MAVGAREGQHEAEVAVVMVQPPSLAAFLDNPSADLSALLLPEKVWREIGRRTRGIERERERTERERERERERMREREEGVYL